MIINSNIHKKRYDENIYDSRPVKFSEYITNKYNSIHNKIYEHAVNLFITDWLNTKNKYAKRDDEDIIEYNERCKNFIDNNPNMKYSCGKIIFPVNSVENFKKYSYIYEIMPNEYYQSCHIKIMTKSLMNIHNLYWEVDLSKYWNKYQEKINNTIYTKKIDINNNFNDAEIIDLDYIKGIAKLYSKSNDKIYNIPFEYLDENTPVASEYLLSNHFSSNIEF